MRLANVSAAPHPDGYRVDLSWSNPDPNGYPGVRVVRRAGTHPTTPADGMIVVHGVLTAVATDADGRPSFRVSDTGLQGETQYYYGLFPYRGDPPDFAVDRANRTSALATSANGHGNRMYALVPAIYRRYDAERDLLRRFLALAGGQLDVLQSVARALLDATALQRVDGGLLPLLGQWIGWRTDFHREIEQQRSEVRDAPSLYQRVGIIPLVEATVKRISGWESRSKEFVHNVFRANAPPRLNVWMRRLAPNGDTVVPESLLSLDYTFDGRPSATIDDHGVRWLAYHAIRRGRCRIWYKTSPTFSLGLQVRAHLAAADVPHLQQDFAAAGVALAASATIAAAGQLWHVNDAANVRTYVVAEEGDHLTVYETSADPLTWAPSRPLNGDVREAIDEKQPVIAQQRDTLWVFWAIHDAVDDRWEIRYRTRRDGAWLPSQAFSHGAGGQPPERRSPAVLVDDDDGLWLFWQERVGTRWQLKYNRFDATTAVWQLDPAAAFPLDGTADPRVEADLFVLFRPDEASRPIWVFWARREALADPGQHRWIVAYRYKESADPADSDWGPIGTLPKDVAMAHDREPAASVAGAGLVLFFWSSDRVESWSVWRATLGVSSTPPTWTAVRQITAGPYDQRHPLPIAVDPDTVLLYGNNASLPYESRLYRSTRTVDFRYAGCATPHVRHTAGLALRGAFEDFQTYTHDTGENSDDWYRRDTLGVYVVPGTMDPVERERGLGRLDRVLPEFLPATDRAVLIPNHHAHTDHVYTYELGGAADPRVVVDEYRDSLAIPPAESALDEGEDFSDELE